MKKLEVCLTPALLPCYEIQQSIVVVIDVLRATSSMCYAFENGVSTIIPVATVEECQAYAGKGYLLAAERNGEVVAGFDFGNSPFSYTAEKVSGKTIVLTTTNGTKAIELSKAAHKVVIGSFLNLSALCDWLKNQNKDVLLLCAGWKDKINLEDTLLAGAVMQRLKSEFDYYCDAAIAAEDLYLLAKDDLRTYLYKSSHSQRMAELNIELDVQFCLQVDKTTVVPVLENGVIKLQSSNKKVEVQS